MRGKDEQQLNVFSYISPERRQALTLILQYEPLPASRV